MSFRLHELKPAPGSRPVGIRRGLGEGSGYGQTAGKVQKGQRSRSGDGKLLGFEGPAIVVKPESLQDGFCFGRILKSPFPFEPVLQITVAFEHLLEINAGLCHAMLEFMHFVLNLLKMAEGCQSRLMYGRALFKVNMLREQPQTDPPGPNHVAPVRRLFPTDQAKDRCLTRPVAAHQANMFAPIDLQCRAPQDVLRAV